MLVADISNPPTESRNDLRPLPANADMTQSVT
jgi:hypothetical protein